LVDLPVWSPGLCLPSLLSSLISFNEMAVLRRLGLVSMVAGHAAAYQAPAPLPGQVYLPSVGNVLIGGGVGFRPNDNLVDGILRDGITNRPVLGITLDDIVVLRAANGQERCCPRGTLFNGERCVFPSSAVCPEGFRPEGNICVGKNKPDCPGNLIYEDGQCVRSEPPNCPPNSEFNKETHQCEGFLDPVCKSPLVPRNGTCTTGPLCNPGYTLVDNQCVMIVSSNCDGENLIPDDLGRCVTKEGPVCPDNTTLVDRKLCVHKDKAACPTGFRLVDNSCFHEEDPKCPQGYIWNKSVCYREELPVCKEGRYSNGNCESIEGPKCDFPFEKKGSVCEHREKPFCDPGMKLFSIEQRTGVDRARCCRDVPGMQLRWSTCEFPATGPEECPPEMTYDPKKKICTSPPNYAKCPQGFEHDKVNNVCISTGSLKCEVGIPMNGRCILPGPPDCGREARFDQKTGRCIGGIPKCPKDSILSGSHCVSIIYIPECPANTTLTLNGMCISTILPTCPDNSTITDGSCVHPHPAKCPDGTYTSGPNCIEPGPTPTCPAGTFLVGSDCVGDEPPRCTPPFVSTGNNKCVSPEGPKCGKDFALDEQGRCVSRLDPLCPPGSQYVHCTKTCVSRETPKCREGDMDAKGNCRKGAPMCPPGTAFIEGVCVGSKQPKCPEGSRHDGVTGKCISVADPECPVGTHMDGDKCVADPACPEKTRLKDGKCVVDTPPDCGGLGLKFSKERNMCVTTGDPKCPDGTVYDRAGRRCTATSKQRCFDLRTCPAVEEAPPTLPDRPIYYSTPEISSEPVQTQEAAAAQAAQVVLEERQTDNDAKDEDDDLEEEDDDVNEETEDADDL